MTNGQDTGTWKADKWNNEDRRDESEQGQNDYTTTTQWIGKGEAVKEKSRKEKSTWRIGIWNVRGLGGKEDELEQEFIEANLDILAIVETKKKGQGVIELSEGHMIIYNGVPEEQRSRAGVGCIINKRWAGKLHNWTGHTERILTVELISEEKQKTSLIIVYGPNEDETTENKNKFWEELSVITENSKGTLYLLGDFNGRVEKRNATSRSVIGNHGENVRNNNGKRLIDFCIQNELIIANTFYEHKDIHKFTREAPSRNEKSIIDYIITERNNRRSIKDVKVRRGPEINSDHYLVEAKIMGNITVDNKRTDRGREIKYETINAYKLKEVEIASRYKQNIEEEIEKLPDTIQEWDTERLWNTFKGIVMKSAKVTCGTKSMNKTRKQTSWWSEEIRKEVKVKKSRWKEYLATRTEGKYLEYKEQRKRVKGIVIEAKKKTWEELAQLAHGSCIRVERTFSEQKFRTESSSQKRS